MNAVRNLAREWYDEQLKVRPVGALPRYEEYADIARDMRHWYEEQVRRYAEELLPRYEQYASDLQRILDRGVRKVVPHIVVEARAKTVRSFADKILRKPYFQDPLVQATDLCGVRVVTHTEAEVKAVGELINGHLDVDKGKSEDTTGRLGSNQFGYRSIHYIAQLRHPQPVCPVCKSALVERRGTSGFVWGCTGRHSPGCAYTCPTVSVRLLGGTFDLTAAVFGLKAEIQVRTLAQHCWANIGHDRIYKGVSGVPEKLVREFNRIAALLELVDNAFDRLAEAVEDSQTLYAPYMTRQETQDRLDLLERALARQADDWRLAHQVARLALSLGAWDRVERHLEPLVAQDITLQVCLGFALCQRHKESSKADDFTRGQGYLQDAVAAAPRNIEALVALAESWVGTNHEEAFDTYRRAFDVKPDNPRVLVGYTVANIVRERGDMSFLPALRASLEEALCRCQEQAQVGADIPWAFYRMGELNLLLALAAGPDDSGDADRTAYRRRKSHDALAAYTKAVHKSVSEFMIVSALETIDRLDRVGLTRQLSALEWVKRLLLLTRAVKFHGGNLEDRLKKLVSREQAEGKSAKLEMPVRIVAGACHPELEEKMKEYRPLLHAAFDQFKGTLISGGTSEGISGLVAELTAGNAGIRAIGYLPQAVPVGSTKDHRYEHRVVGRDDFSPLQPLQDWIDLLDSGLETSLVKIFGVNGGRIAAFEYRLGLVLGAEVYVLKGSGRAADELFADPDWSTVKNLKELPDKKALRLIMEDRRETLAQRIHEAYVAEQMERERDRLLSSKPTLADWEHLAEDYKEANRRQVRDIEKKLDSIHIDAFAVNDREIILLQLEPAEVDQLAAMEHESWREERTAAGWTHGPARSEKDKKHPLLVPWADLPEDVKKMNCGIVHKIPQLLYEVGMELRRRPGD